MLNVIDYMPGDTLLHKLNPVAKVALAASIIAATFLSNSYAMLVGLLAFTLLMGAYAGVAGRLVVLMKLLVPLALICAAGSFHACGHACVWVCHR